MTDMTDESRVSGLRLIRHVLIVFGVALALNIAGTGWQFFRVAGASRDNCARIHQVVATLDAIIASGDKLTEKYVREGLLIPEQAAHAAVYREEQRDVLRGADCPAPRR